MSCKETMFRIFLCVLTFFCRYNPIEGEHCDEVSEKSPNVYIDQFSNDVNDLLQELDEKYSMTESIGNARKKMQEVRFEKWDNDCKSAGMLVNLYTNSDEIIHLPGVTFYRSLGQAIKSDNPGFIWQKCEQLLNIALNIIGHETFDIVFRGERRGESSIPDDLTEGSSYKERGFWSTTLDPSVTDHFGGAEYAFIIIKNVQGVNVQHVSVTDMEKEVLVPSSREYILKKKISNKEEQQKVLKRIHLRYPNFKPSKFNPENIFIFVPKPSNFNPENISIHVPLKEDGEHDEL